MIIRSHTEYLVYILHYNDIVEDHMCKEVTMVERYFQLGFRATFLRSCECSIHSV